MTLENIADRNWPQYQRDLKSGRFEGREGYIVAYRSEQLIGMAQTPEELQEIMSTKSDPQKSHSIYVVGKKKEIRFRKPRISERPDGKNKYSYELI